MKRIIMIVYLSILFSNPFIPEIGQSINYIQVFFRWPQISYANNYEFKLSENEYLEELTFIDTIESNSFLLNQMLNWDTIYYWQVCSTDLYSNDCIYGNYFTTNALPEYHTDQIDVLYIDEQNYDDGINILDFESLFY